MRLLHRWLLLGALLGAALPALAAAGFRGVVTHVTDGDTLWVRPAGAQEAVEIRLVGIDAPEGCQAFGPQAKKALLARVLRQTVQVQPRGQDDYRRMLALVRHRGEDLSGWLVLEGHAWSSEWGSRPGAYEKLEDRARAARRGLWSRPRPQEPRQFRRSHGPCR